MTLILGAKPGHDGSVVAVEDGRLLFSLEAERDSHARHASLHPGVWLDAASRLDRVPDVVAVGGWERGGHGFTGASGAGYFGTQVGEIETITLLGQPVRYYTSSHERSHIMMAVGMAGDPAPREAVLVWEGAVGSFYEFDRRTGGIVSHPVMSEPGGRYAFLYALADPNFPDSAPYPRVNDAGKLMALAAFGDPDPAPDVTEAVQAILELPSVYPPPKASFRKTPLYNCGPEAQPLKDAARHLGDRIYRAFADAAVELLPPGIPLRISGGCGLNIEWNTRWRSERHFSSVFVPPCTNDSGSAIGTALDAAWVVEGRDPRLEWDVYCGARFWWDDTPERLGWSRRDADLQAMAQALAEGAIVAWVEGRYELGPRALAARSLLAAPFGIASRNRLNAIKRRESYRPIAPSCRAEELDRWFREAIDDPHMLYRQQVTSDGLKGITHVDGTARVHVVHSEASPGFHALLTAFRRCTGVGVLCNTSLNYPGCGFLNRISDLLAYCEDRGVHHAVIDGVHLTAG